MTWKSLSYLYRTSGNNNKTPCSQELLLCYRGDGPLANKENTHRALDSDNVEKNKAEQSRKNSGRGERDSCQG